jgi:hypothetical protein
MIADEEIAALAEALAALKDRVARLERMRAANGGVTPSLGRELTSVGDTTCASPRAWSSLVRWVRAVATAYQLDNHDLPLCWHEHGAYVRELAALQLAHDGACLSLAGDARAMVVWHSDLQAALGRLRGSHVGQRCATQHADATVVRTERVARIVNQHSLPSDRLTRSKSGLRPTKSRSAHETTGLGDQRSRVSLYGGKGLPLGSGDIAAVGPNIPAHTEMSLHTDIGP